MTSPRSILFRDATIISYDSEAKTLKILRNAFLLVTNGCIVQLGEGQPPDVLDDTEIVDAAGKIVSPGFVNTHHHLWQTAFKTLAANETLNEYLGGNHSQLGPAGKHFTPEDVYFGQLACAMEMIDGGTTTVVDHAHAVFSDEHIDKAVEASFHSGLRIFFAHTIQTIEAAGYTAEMGIEKLLKLSKDPRFADDTNPVELGVAYDGWAFAPMEVNTNIMDLIVNHNNTVSSPDAALSVLTTHQVGGPFSAYNSATRLDSLPNSALSQPLLTTPKKLPIIISHASFMDSKDAKLIRDHPHVSISTTPECEAHFGQTSVGSEMCQDCASLGVDAHFAFSSYMPFQARLWMQSRRDKYYRQVMVDNWEVPLNNPMSPEAAFLLMTQKGGEALGRADLGVIEVGAQADLVMFDAKNSTGMWGAYDPVAAILLHSGGAGDVDAVMVQGRWLKKNHKLVSPLAACSDITMEKIRTGFEASASRIRDIWRTLETAKCVEGDESVSGARYGKAKTIDVRRKAANI